MKWVYKMQQSRCQSVHRKLLGTMSNTYGSIRYRNWRNLGLRWCWIIWQNGSKISIIVIQLTKSTFPTTASSEKMSPNDCDNDGQPEIATWPLKPKIAIATWATFSELVMIENPRFAVGISTVSITDVRRPYCYFRLTVVVEIIHEHCL